MLQDLVSRLFFFGINFQNGKSLSEDRWAGPSCAELMVPVESSTESSTTRKFYKD